MLFSLCLYFNLFFYVTIYLLLSLASSSCFIFTDDLILLAVSINPGFNLNWLDLGFCWGFNISHEAIQSGFYFHGNGSLSSQFVIYRESNSGAGGKAPRVDLFSSDRGIRRERS